MDPFSGVTALIPIAIMLLKAGHELKVFVGALRTAPEDAQHFMDEIVFYSKFLEKFDRTELVEHVVKQAAIVMKGVKEDVFPIFEAVHAEENLASTSFMTRWKWCSKKSEVANLRRCLAEAKSTAQLLLGMFSYDMNRRNEPSPPGLANNLETRPFCAEFPEPAQNRAYEVTFEIHELLGLRRVFKKRGEHEIGQIGCKSGSETAALAAAYLALPKTTKTVSGMIELPTCKASLAYSGED
ncbi:hypothetical protein PG994_012275 [Apiospora phragmitis]|uniref:Uncharacterized protein n=1 Tax=Apiospora phragmitis TaxID=2905665 RepID=A0ABR1TV49_9PEZI